MGFDRPSSDFANARRFIFLISSHLEAGHYFNPHAQRIMEGKAAAPPSSASTRACRTPARRPTGGCRRGRAPSRSLLLGHRPAVAAQRHLGARLRAPLDELGDLPGRAPAPTCEPTFERRWSGAARRVRRVHPRACRAHCGVSADERSARSPRHRAHPAKFASHNWRAAGAGNLGGWQVARCLFFLNVLTGSVATVGGTSGNGWNKFIPVPPKGAPRRTVERAELAEGVPARLPRDVDPAAALPQRGPGHLDTYFSRVYNPIWTNPDGFSWLEALKDPDKVGCHVALTPTWSETAWFADYVLPMGVGAERHDLASFETHAGAGSGSASRSCAATRRSRARGRPRARTHEFNPGEVWEENEFWIDLSWRSTPTVRSASASGSSRRRAGQADLGRRVLRHLFATRCPAWPRPPPRQGQTPLEYMRERRGLRSARRHDHPVRAPARRGRSSTGAPRATTACTASPAPRRPGTAIPTRLDGTCRPRRRLARRRGRRRGQGGLPHAVEEARAVLRPTLADWGWPEYATPTWIPSHVHWEDLDIAGTSASCCRRSGSRRSSTPARQQRSGSTRSATATRCGSTRATPRSSASRSRARAHHHPHRPLRDRGLAHRGHPPRRRGGEPPHGPLAPRRRQGPLVERRGGRHLVDAERRWRQHLEAAPYDRP
jgi:hypothetical protein